jgi:hypothetical protein
LGGNLGAGQRKVEGGHHQGGECCPFLDGMAVGECPQQRKQRAHGKEHHPGDHRHVIAGDRENVPEAGNVHGIVHRRGKGVALACDQRRCNRSLVAGQDGAHACVDRFAHPIDGRGVAQRKRRRARRRLRADASKHEAGGADALEVHVARVVIAAGAQRLERRSKACLELHEIADRRRCALAQRYPNALELLAHARSFHALNVHGDAVGALALFPHLDEAANLDVPQRRRENRMRDDCALDGSGCQSERSRRCAERQRKPERTMPKPHRHDDGRGEKNAHRPGRRLPIGAEIDDDAASEENSKPGYQPAHAHLGRKPFAKPAGSAPRRDCNKTRPEPGGSCRGGRRSPGLSSACRSLPARSFRLHHRVAPAPPQRLMLYEAGQPVSHVTASAQGILDLSTFEASGPLTRRLRRPTSPQR